MRILFAALRHDYGIASRGLSFEYYNFYEPLVKLGHDVTYFDLGQGSPGSGAGSADSAFMSAVEGNRPDLVFTFLFGDELSPTAIGQVTARGIPTLNWFADDHWRFEEFTSRYAPNFAWVATTAQSALPKYAALGVTNVIKTQWAAAQHLYRPTNRPLRYGVTFVGQVYGERRGVIEGLRASGLPVRAWGTGWGVRRWHRVAARLPVVSGVGGRRLLAKVQGGTRCDQMQMIEIFGTSRINLNLADSSQQAEAQIKGRTFEVPACGGFLLTGWAQDLEQYYEPDREMAVFYDAADLHEKTRYYLSHESDRARIAHAGYVRTVADHTYQRRFSEIFTRMGLPRPRPLD
jgi:spore maturation protein CgeB